MPTAVIIGAGLAGLRTAAELRSRAYPGRIILIGAETSPPYDRPPLSSHLLTRTEPVWLAEDLNIDWPGVADEVHLGVRAIALEVGDPSTIHTDTGAAFTADDVIIATGSTAVNPWPGTSTLTTLEDAASLRRALAGGAKQVVIIGAGWIGVELAHGLSTAGHDVTLIEAERDPLAEHLAEAAAHLRPWLSHIDVRTGTRVTGVDITPGGGTTIQTTHGEVHGDVAITAIGMRPATTWLESSGIVTDSRGFIPVDAGGRVPTDVGRVWAVGDAATHTHPVFGDVPGGHWFSALRDPTRVAADIIGAEAAAGNAPEIFSNQGEHHVEVLGSLTGTETALRGDPADGVWVLFHLREGRLIGAIVANSPRDTSSIRRALAREELIEISAAELEDTSVPLRKLLRR